jgi:hypothetical protein
MNIQCSIWACRVLTPTLCGVCQIARIFWTQILVYVKSLELSELKYSLWFDYSNNLSLYYIIVDSSKKPHHSVCVHMWLVCTINLMQTRGIWEEGPSVEELHALTCGMSMGIFLIDNSCRLAQPTLGDASPGHVESGCTRKLSEPKSDRVSQLATCSLALCFSSCLQIPASRFQSSLIDWDL